MDIRDRAGIDHSRIRQSQTIDDLRAFDLTGDYWPSSHRVGGRSNLKFASQRHTPFHAYSDSAH